jgi:cytochrome c oxidase subunit 2
VLRRRQHLWRYLFVFAALALLLTGCGDPRLNTLDPSGPAGRVQLSLIQLSFWIMFGVLTVVTIIYVYVLVRFRERPGQNEIPKQVEGNTKLEILWTVIPIVLLAVLAVPTVSTTFSLSKKSPQGEAIEVKVVGHQYWWEFIYPQYGFRTSQELHIPVGKKVHFEVTSTDVIHAFWVPNLGGKVDAIPGKKNYMWLQADKPGRYTGKCAELCGASHALMDFTVIAQTQQDFDKWVKAQQHPQSMATNKTLEQGKKLVAQNCIGCHAVRGAGFRYEGKKGPELTGFGQRTTIAGFLPHDEKHLQAWLKNPQAFKPGARMPKIGYLDDQEMKALTQYLMSLK